MAGHHEDLKRTLRAARNQAGIKSDQELALRAGVHLQTIQNWMSGKTTPRPAEVSKVATALDVSMADLLAVYEGRDPKPPPLQDAVRDLTGAVRELVTEIREERKSETSVAHQLEKVEAVLESLVRQAIPDGDGQPAPHELGR